MKPQILSAVAGALLLAQPAQAKQVEGVSMPNQITIDGTRLVLNGMGVREATFLKIKVYVAGLYLEQRSKDANHIAASEELKQMRLTFLRDVSREDMVKNIDSGFRNGAGTEYDKLKPRLTQLTGWLPTLNTGDSFTMTYRPGKGLEVTRPGSSLLIPGADFARAVFLIWLGKNPPNPGLKSGLLGEN